MNATTDLLFEAGIASSATVLAALIPAFTAWTPAVSQPTNSQTIMLVRGVQKLLNKHGYALKIDGILGTNTSRALELSVGKGWQRMTWAVIYARLAALPTPKDIGTGQAVNIDIGVPSSNKSKTSQIMTTVAIAAGAAWLLGIIPFKKR